MFMAAHYRGTCRSATLLRSFSRPLTCISSQVCSHGSEHWIEAPVLQRPHSATRGRSEPWHSLHKPQWRNPSVTRRLPVHEGATGSYLSSESEFYITVRLICVHFQFKQVNSRGQFFLGMTTEYFHWIAESGLNAIEISYLLIDSRTYCLVHNSPRESSVLIQSTIPHSNPLARYPFQHCTVSILPSNGCLPDGLRSSCFPTKILYPYLISSIYVTCFTNLSLCLFVLILCRDTWAAGLLWGHHIARNILRPLDRKVNLSSNGVHIIWSVIFCKPILQVSQRSEKATEAVY
jgi:hypothetical protein